MAVVDFVVRDFIATLTINRPEARNAMSPEVMVRLDDAWREVRDSPAYSRRDPDWYRLEGVLRGRGPRVVSAARDRRATTARANGTRAFCS